MMRFLKLAAVSIGVALLVFSGLCGSPVQAGAPVDTPQPTEASNPVPGEPLAVKKDRSSFPDRAISHTMVEVKDAFGYSWDNSPGLAWIDATSGTLAVMNSNDDGYTDAAVSLGFSFPFYEHDYTRVFISTNGLLVFPHDPADPDPDAPNNVAEYHNELIPQSIFPNSLIAVFWDDLIFGGGYNDGHVYYQSGVDLQGRHYFVVEWHETSQRSGSNLLTFEAVLYDTGDICIQYQNLDNIQLNATVGIEDGDGVDGLQYSYNAGDVGSGDVVYFQRPADSTQVKLLPDYQGGFALNQTGNYHLTVTNIGQAGSDTYDLIFNSSSPDWGVTFYSDDGVTPLTDSDQNGKVDTGPLAPGSGREIVAKLNASSALGIGASAIVEVEAVSPQSGNTFTAKIDCAWPSQFAQAVADNDGGIILELVGSHNVRFTKVEEWFSGSTLALAGSEEKFIYTWERRGSKEVGGGKFIDYSNIEYVVMNNRGGFIRRLTKVYDNETSLQTTRDRSPAPVISADGTIGMMWWREIVDQEFRINSNVFFTLLDQSGAPLIEPINMTNNTAWRGPTDLDIPLFSSPHLVALENNRFVLIWVDQRSMAAGDLSDVWYAIYDQQGNPVKSPTKLTSGLAGVQGYQDPMSLVLDNNRILVTTIDDVSKQISIIVLDASGTVVLPQTALAGAAGWGPDAEQLSTGSILLAWTQPDEQIAYLLLDGANYSINHAPVALTNPIPRPSDNVSVTKDELGQGILTWMETPYNDHLYYALIGDNGSLITSPMVFYTGQAFEPIVVSSYGGMGNAYYAGTSNMIFFPTILH